MSTNCVPILASLFKYSYEADFIEGILRENGKRLIKSLILHIGYIDGVLSKPMVNLK